MKKILIADDSATIIKLISVYLHEHGGKEKYEIFKAQDGAEALFILKDEKIDLIFLDMMMPIVDGYSVAKYIHSRKLDTQTIIISSSLDKAMVLSLGKLGFKNFLPKPLNSSKIKAILEKFA